MRYSVDASILIEGWRRQFPPDVVPGFWEGLDELIKSGDLRATEEVLYELDRKDDEVYEWIKTRKELFISIDETIQAVVSKILTTHPTLIDSRRNRSSADPFVIALAFQNSCIVLTDEIPTGKPHRPHIPDVCSAYGIQFDNLLGLVRREGWVFKR
jgi:hypothetical protein